MLRSLLEWPPSTTGPVAQRQSRGLIIPWLLVRIQPGPLVQFDASCGDPVPEETDFSEIPADSRASSSSSSVQTGTWSDKVDAGRMSPVSAPLGTTDGTFFGAGFPAILPSVPVARTA